MAAHSPRVRAFRSRSDTVPWSCAEFKRGQAGGRLAMGRGFVAGGVFLSAGALLCALLGCAGGGSLRSWLVRRTEVYAAACSRGEGVFSVGDAWGDDIHGLWHRAGECQGRPVSSGDAYCRAEHAGDFERHMCVRTIVNKCLSLPAVMFHVGAIGAALFCSAVRDPADQHLPAVLGAVFAMLASLASWAAFLTMATSELFSQAHADRLSAEAGLIVPFRGIGCVFQEPFSSPWWPFLLVRDWQQECLLFGNAYILAVLQATLSFLGSLIMLLAVVNLQGVRPLEEPLLDNAEAPADGEFSLHGAFYRHLSRRHGGWLVPRLVSMSVPALLLATLWLTIVWIVAGVRFTMNVVADVSILPIHFDFAYQVFNFNSVTSVTDLWHGRAFLMSVLTLLATFVVPIAKLALWLYLWYIPCEQVLRGRILSWLDALGKIALATVFCLAMMATGFLFDAEIDPLGIVRVGVHVGVNTGFVSTWGFLLPTMLSMAIGRWFVDFQGRAARWEQIRCGRSRATLRRTPSLYRILDSPFVTATTAASSPAAESDADDARSVAPFEASALRGATALTKHDNSQYTLSPWARRAVDAALACAWVCTLAGLAVPSFGAERHGVVAEVFLAGQRHVSWSVFGMVEGANRLPIGEDSQLNAFSTPIVIFVVVAPIMHLVGLSVLWRFAVDTLHGQETLYLTVETLAACNALDIYVVSLAVSAQDISMVGDTVIPQVIPGLTKLLESTLGLGTPYFCSASSLPAGFWLLLLAVVIEKLLTTLLVPLYAAQIANGRLREVEAQHQRAMREGGQVAWEEEGEGEGEGGRGSSGGARNEQARGDQQQREESRERQHVLNLLSPNAAYIATNSVGPPWAVLERLRVVCRVEAAGGGADAFHL